EPHLSSLQAYCCKLSGNRFDGEDLYQSTLEKAFRSFNNQSVLKKAYLFRIAKNTWIDGLRKKNVDQVPLKDEHIRHPYDGNMNIREAFEEMANVLTVRQSVLLLMMDVFGFTAKETASHLGSTEGAIKE